MQQFKFAWPLTVYATSRKPIEEAMVSFVTKSAPEGTFCHEGQVEVDVALTQPLRARHNAVLICSCGKPRATLESKEEENEWTFHPIARI